VPTAVASRKEQRPCHNQEDDSHNARHATGTNAHERPQRTVPRPRSSFSLGAMATQPRLYGKDNAGQPDGNSENSQLDPPRRR
jgi:hypothetical protein